MQWWSILLGAYAGGMIWRHDLASLLGLRILGLRKPGLRQYANSMIFVELRRQHDLVT